MKNTLTYIADGLTAALILALLMFSILLVYGIKDPENATTYAAYDIPVIGTTAKALALQVAEDIR